MRCSAMSGSGRRCKAQALRGHKRCLLHSGRAKELGRRGAAMTQQRRILRKRTLKALRPPKTATDVVTLIGTIMGELRTKEIDVSVANSIFFALNPLLKAMDASSMEERLARLEEKAGLREQVLQ